MAGSPDLGNCFVGCVDLAERQSAQIKLLVRHCLARQSCTCLVLWGICRIIVPAVAANDQTGNAVGLRVSYRIWSWHGVSSGLDGKGSGLRAS